MQPPGRAGGETVDKRGHQRHGEPDPRREVKLEIIETEADIARRVAALAAREPAFSRALAQTGPPPLRRWAPGYPGLLRIVAAQLLSTEAAAAIHARLCAAGLDHPAIARAAPDDAFRACGLSRPKLRCVRAALELDFGGLDALPDDAVRKRLLAAPGIGPWSADIYLLFCLGRADAFAPGDLALREAARMLFSLPERPSIRALDALSRAWSPDRGVAARLLWAYYGNEKRREAVRRAL